MTSYFIFETRSQIHAPKKVCLKIQDKNKIRMFQEKDNFKHVITLPCLVIHINVSYVMEFLA